MGVRRYEDLEAWQLARELERRVSALIDTAPARCDRIFCDDIRRSSKSAARNICEGFARFYPGDFAKFVRNALGSLNETTDHLEEALERGYITADAHADMVILARRAIGASTNLVKYLTSDAARRRFKREGTTRRPRTRED